MPPTRLPAFCLLSALHFILTSLVPSAADPALPAAPYARYHGNDAIAADGKISRWPDRGGIAARDLSRVIGAPTSASYAHRGGRPDSRVVALNGASAVWAAAGDWGSVGGSRTVVVRARLGAAAGGVLFDGSTSVGKSRARVVGGTWQAGIQKSTAGWTAGDLPTTAATPGEWQTHLFEFEAAGGSTTVRHFIEGADAGGGGTLPFLAPQGGLILGMNGGAGDGMRVEIAEMAVYDRLLSPAEKSAAFGWFENEWGDLFDAPLAFSSATVIQAERAVSRIGIHGVAALVVTSRGQVADPDYALKGLRFTLDGTSDLADIETILIYDGGPSSAFDVNSATLLATVAPAAGTIAVDLDRPVASSPRHFWIAAKTRRDAALGHHLDAAITGFHFTGEAEGAHVPDVSSPPGKLTIADVPFVNVLHAQNQDGVGFYRIPGLVVTNAGTLIASFDLRYGGSAPDLPADMDVGIRRSTDGGLTWQPVQVIMDKDKNVPGSQGNGVGDPALLLDRVTGRIWCAALWSKGNNGWNGSGPGLEENETGQFLLNFSDDDGVTWSEPVSITKQVKQPEWRLFFQGPGKGICTRDGTLIFPSQFRDGNGVARSNFIYSTNRGATWHTAPAAVPTGAFHTNECQIVERDDGSLLMSMKNFDSRKERLWCIYSWNKSSQTIADGSWGPTWYSQNDPTVMGSVQRYRSVLDEYPFSAILFANPDSKTSRSRMTVRVSFDEGLTWPYKRLVDERPAAYSCMAVLPDGDIGMLYETGDASSIADLTFIRFPFEWITGTADSDNDGIPDYYEDATGMDKNDPADAARDADGDGQSNLFEYRAGTNPNDPDSRFQTGSVRMSEGGDEIRIAWTAMPGVAYRVERSPDLEPDGWTPLPDMETVPAATVVRDLEIAVPRTGDDRMFYRIAAVR